jgi:HD-GYP domain-containing protein (c-di-GMP phosphodiesterase class II)
VVIAYDEPKDVNQLYENSISYVLESIRGVVSGEAPDIFTGAKLAELIVESLSEGSSLILAATDREQDYAVSRHSVNVAIFATRVAHTLGRDLQCQREVCLAGLLHELGVGKLPAKLVHRDGPMTPEELRLMRLRPIQSGEIIGDLGREYVWLAKIAKQVTERENGTGSPIGLVGEEIDDRAKIIGIADVFDACIHRRPYRDSVSGYQALFELTTDQQRAFSDQMVKALIRSFSLYPLNECVRLSTGEVGKVVDINPENLSRPVVTILFDRDGTALIEPKTVDLGHESSLYIAEALVGRRCPSLQGN